jgi:hypothetical protein
MKKTFALSFFCCLILSSQIMHSAAEQEQEVTLVTSLVGMGMPPKNKRRSPNDYRKKYCITRSTPEETQELFSYYADSEYCALDRMARPVAITGDAHTVWVMDNKNNIYELARTVERVRALLIASHPGARGAHYRLALDEGQLVCTGDKQQMRIDVATGEARIQCDRSFINNRSLLTSAVLANGDTLAIVRQGK